jgi:hypothetical protein
LAVPSGPEWLQPSLMASLGDHEKGEVDRHDVNYVIMFCIKHDRLLKLWGNYVLYIYNYIYIYIYIHNIFIYLYVFVVFCICVAGST